MKPKRPVNLNLLTLHFPIPSIISILHRISGVVLFLCIPLLLWLFNFSLASSDNFNTIHHALAIPHTKVLIWLALLPLCFHLVAGIRHLMVDMHIGEDLPTGRLTAYLTLLFSAILAILCGVWLW